MGLLSGTQAWAAPCVPSPALGALAMLAPSRRNTLTAAVALGAGTDTAEQPVLVLSHAVAMEMVTLSEADILPPRTPGYWAIPLAPALGPAMQATRSPAAGGDAAGDVWVQVPGCR